MPRKHVNIGTNPNDSTGDTLRVAFTKINDNFSELYGETAADSQISFSGNKISANASNADLVLEGSGTGGVQLGALRVDGTSISSDDSTVVNINENVIVQGTITSRGVITADSYNGDGSNLTGITADQIGDLTTIGSTITAPSNADLTLATSGTGSISLDGIQIKGTSISSTDSTQININENVNVDGNLVFTGSLTGDGSGLTGITATTVSTPFSVDNLNFDDNTISSDSNADINITPGGTGAVNIMALTVNGTELSSTDSTQITIKENLHVTGTITGDGSGLTGVVATSIASPLSIDNITLDDNIISTSSNANLNLNPGGTGTVELQANTNIDGDATATTFIGDLRGATVFQAKATEDITKGEAVYISGLSGNTPEVALARANSASTMPAFGIAESDIANTATGNIVTFGSCPGHDVADFGETSITFALGDTVYISSAEAGKLTNVAPTGESNLIQNIGKIERATPTTNMTIKVGGAGRTNATPALNDGNIFIGNGSNQSSTVSLATQIKSYTGLTVVGDDSTGTSLNIGETFKVAGATGVTTAVSGDTLTITGPNLSSYLTDTTLNVVADDSATMAINNNGVIQFSGSRGVSTSTSSSGTVTITGPDLSSYITASSSDTLTNKTIDANGTGNSISNIEVADFAGSAIINVAETLASNDSDTALVTAGAIIDYVDAQDANIASDTLTLTNKTFDVEATGNSISNIDVADFKAAAIVTEGEGIGSNDNDTTIPTSAAVKDYVDNNAGGTTGDLTITGSTISAPSNADLTLNAGGTGSVDIDGIQIKGTSISSTDSTQININENVNIDGTLTVSGTQLSGTLITAGNTGTGSVALASESLQVTGTTNEINVDAAAFALSLSLADNISGIVSVTASGYLANDAIKIDDNKITGLRSNEDIHIDPAGTGGIIAQAPVTFNAGYIEKINTLTSSPTITVNCATASIHKVTLATNTGFVITNLPTGGTVTLIITQDGGGSNTATFGTDGSTAVKFPGGTSTLSTGGGDIDVVTIVNDGTNFLGNIAKDYS